MWFVVMVGCAQDTGDTGLKPDPAAEIEVEPMEIAFGEVRVDGAPATADLTVQNLGDADLTLTAIRVGSVGPYTVTPSEAVVPPGGVLHATVLYDPTAEGLNTDVVEVLSLDADEPAVQVQLSGTGV